MNKIILGGVFLISTNMYMCVNMCKLLKKDNKLFPSDL